MAIFISARARAFSVSETCRASAICAATMFHAVTADTAAKNRATFDRSGGRSVLLMLPASFTSRYALAYRCPLRAGGGSARNCLELRTAKGVTPPQCKNAPPAAEQAGVGCHSPGSDEEGR